MLIKFECDEKKSAFDKIRLFIGGHRFERSEIFVGNRRACQ